MKTSYIKWILVSGLLAFTNMACVTTTPIGDVVVDGSISVEPQVVYQSRSRVTIGIGPSYTLDDAFYLANNHCRGYGYYAVPSSSRWDYTYGSYRNLNYYCRRRPVIINRPVVVTPPRPHYRPHPTPPPVRRDNGWWSRNQPHPPVVTPTPAPSHRPHPAPPASRPERDSRVTTPQSPWSYNPGKNSTPPVVVTPSPRPTPAPPAPRAQQETRSTTPPSPWSYNSKKNEEPARRTYTPLSTTNTSSSGGGFWGKNTPSSKTSSGSSSSDRSTSSSKLPSVTSPSSSSSSSSPSWWGKNKK